MVRSAIIVSLLAVLMVFRAHAEAPVIATDRVRILIERGDGRRAVGDAIGALGYYRDAITAGPRRADGYLALGRYHRALAEPGRALEVFDAAARAQVYAPALVIEHAETLTELGQSARAVTLLRRLVQVEPTGEAGLAALAGASESRGAFIEALSARRAIVGALIARAAEPEAIREAQTRVRAIERILGDAERTRSTAVCDDAQATPVSRALARCP